MLREEAINVETRQDAVDDEDAGFESSNLATVFITGNARLLVDFGSLSDESSGFEDDDDVLSIHEEINNVEGDRDCVGNDDEGFRSEHDSSDDDDEHSKLDRFPKYNSKTGEINPRFAIGMFFSCRVELKAAIDTLSIKDARDVKYIRSENKRVRAICKDDECKWYIYARKLSGEIGL
ncbi:hypothetical protein LIER_03692 [Lithospermum erythrorhizon]|uniref:Transposase MuDR plant domain-containing protein n=1 Tax=Lithospermum erythrorhizon TaxID=34254 RepID=A0AAV3NVK3_LITER